MLQITIDNKIRIQLPPDAKSRWPGLMEQLRKDMVLDNPAYQEALKYDRSTRGIPARIALWEFDQDARVLSLPRGYAGQLIRFLKQHDIAYQLNDARVTLPPVSFNLKISLRSYQKPAVEALLKATQGTLQAPAGSGKTQMGLEVIARLKQPALWLTHTKDLARQAADRAAQVLGIPREEVGMLGAGREKIGPRLTVGIVQKMVQMDLASVAGSFGTVIIDEVHHSPASTWAAVVSQLPAKYRYGVTATFERADGLEVITDRVIGPTLYVIGRGQVEAAGGMVIPELQVIRTSCESKTWERYEQRATLYKENGWKPPAIPFGDILSEILRNPERNRLIIDTLARECPGHCSLVLSERVSHCEELAAWLKSLRPDLRAEVIHGRLSKGKRQEILAAMSAGELDVLFAVDIAKEGLDIPRLDRLFLVAGGRNEAEVEQKVGRIQRPYPGKKEAVVFDFVDEKIGVLRAQHWARRKVYRKLGIRLEKAAKSA
jgi:superfamily II DNA or RNA helicase